MEKIKFCVFTQTVFNFEFALQKAKAGTHESFMIGDNLDADNKVVINAEFYAFL